MTGTPKFREESSFRALETPLPGDIPVSVSCMVVPRRLTSEQASADYLGCFDAGLSENTSGNGADPPQGKEKVLVLTELIAEMSCRKNSRGSLRTKRIWRYIVVSESYHKHIALRDEPRKLTGKLLGHSLIIVRKTAEMTGLKSDVASAALADSLRAGIIVDDDLGNIEASASFVPVNAVRKPLSAEAFDRKISPYIHKPSNYLYNMPVFNIKLLLKILGSAY